MLVSRQLFSIQDMLNLPIGKLLTAHANLSGFNQAITGTSTEVFVTPDSYSDLKRHTTNLLEACGDIGMPVTKAAVSEFFDELVCAEQKEGNFGFRSDSCLRMKARLQASMNCFGYESGLKSALILPPEMAKYYDPQSPLFGEEVHFQFPVAAYEIEEAAKCLAVGRSTAAVFHLMRVMEVGIHAVARCLGVPDPVKGADKNWGVILKRIQAARSAKGSSTQGTWNVPTDDAYFDAAHATLDAVRNAWRNTTMHVENKYTAEEAEHILVAVRGFMMKLASRMDEQGMPLA
jgi:hypothetical protein